VLSAAALARDEWRTSVARLAMWLTRMLTMDGKLADHVADNVAEDYVVEYVTVIKNLVYYVSELV
jgi:hypothetical protein